MSSRVVAQRSWHSGRLGITAARLPASPALPAVLPSPVCLYTVACHLRLPACLPSPVCYLRESLLLCLLLCLPACLCVYLCACLCTCLRVVAPLFDFKLWRACSLACLPAMACLPACRRLHACLLARRAVVRVSAGRMLANCVPFGRCRQHDSNGLVVTAFWKSDTDIPADEISKMLPGHQSTLFFPPWTFFSAMEFFFRPWTLCCSYFIRLKKSC